MMQLKSITAAKDIPFPGVEFVKTDKAITEVIIGKLRIRKGESYSPGLQVLIEAPFEEAKRFRLTATIEGFPPRIEHFESRYDADRAAEKITSEATVEIAEVTVLVNDDGQIVGEEGAAKPVKADADPDLVPF